MNDACQALQGEIYITKIISVSFSFRLQWVSAIRSHGQPQSAHQHQAAVLIFCSEPFLEYQLKFLRRRTFESRYLVNNGYHFVNEGGVRSALYISEVLLSDVTHDSDNIFRERMLKKCVLVNGNPLQRFHLEVVIGGVAFFYEQCLLCVNQFIPK